MKSETGGMRIDDPSFPVLIEPQGWRFDAPGSATLLAAAQLAGVRLPSSCRNGTCRLRSGRISYRIEWPGLSADEKKDGFILPCVAHPESDLVVEAPAAARHS